MIELALMATLLASYDTCERVLTPPPGQDAITLTGNVGRDLRENRIWLRDFGCGADKSILLAFSYAEIEAEPGGLRAIEALKQLELDALQQGELHVPDTGLRFRAVGRVESDSILRVLDVEQLQLLEAGQ